MTADLSLAADMLEGLIFKSAGPGYGTHGRYTVDAIREQQRLLREADNAHEARTVSRSAPSGGGGEIALEDRIEFALRDAGFDYDEAFRISRLSTAGQGVERMEKQ